MKFEIVVDNFAGGGGASTGIEAAIGRPVDAAINHDAEAIAMHAANHPLTKHYNDDIWSVDPSEVAAGRPIGLAWFSPDCTHFSKAKGGQPRSKAVRGLAWVVIEWAARVRPRVIMLENVEEFQTWGPLDDEGQPIRELAGETFGQWLDALQSLGYEVERRQLRASDYGTPTSRRRLFIIARNDGQPITWPDRTHDGEAIPYRTAGECIDWSVRAPSIFERKRPLADNTLRRISAGIQRFVIDAPNPFLVSLTHQGGPRVESLDDPFKVVTAAHCGEKALVIPTLVTVGYGEREGQAPRILDLDKPLGTVVSSGVKHALAASFLTKFYGTNVGADLNGPMPTVTATGQHLGEVRAFLLKFYGTNRVGQPLTDPMHTVTTKDRLALVTVQGEPYQIADIGMRMLTPRELYRAQGFADSYKIDPLFNGKTLSKTAQVRMCGNSVCPPVARALVTANVALEAA